MLTQTAADQFPHHPGGPQGKGQFELFGAFVRDPGPHAPCLGLGQPAFAPAMGVQATVKQRLFTVTGVVAQPLIDGLTAKRSSTRSSFQTSRKTRAIGRPRSAGGSGCSMPRSIRYGYAWSGPSHGKINSSGCCCALSSNSSGTTV